MKIFKYSFSLIILFFIAIHIHNTAINNEWIPFIGLILILLSAISIRHIELKKIQYNLEKSHQSALENMIYLVEIHDKETGEHILRTKHYAKVLATYLFENNYYPKTINKQFIDDLFKACPLHDIGKVGIPDAILQKAGKLTDDEYEVIKEHPVLGKKIVDQALLFYNKNSLLTLVHDVVYYHHERWDGKGYPSQLKGDEIPLSAQIMSLCDVYDALVSKRYYKKAFSYEKADKIIIESRGDAFNPILIDAFIEVRHSFHEIADRWKE